MDAAFLPISVLIRAASWSFGFSAYSRPKKLTLNSSIISSPSKNSGYFFVGLRKEFIKRHRTILPALHFIRGNQV
jgi:hypothetical protein